MIWRGDVNLNTRVRRFPAIQQTFKQSPKISHETIFTTTGEPYSCWFNQWTKVSSIGFATTDPTVQTPAASTPEVPGPADAIAR